MSFDPTAGANMQFTPASAIQVNSARPEAISQGLAQGIQGLAGGVIGGMRNQSMRIPQQASPYADGQAPVIAQSPAQATPFYQQAVSDMGYPSNYSPALQQAMFNAGALAPMNATYFSGNPFLQQ